MSEMTLKEIIAEMRSLLGLAQKEQRRLTDEEEKRFSELKAQKKIYRELEELDEEEKEEQTEEETPAEVEEPKAEEKEPEEASEEEKPADGEEPKEECAEGEGEEEPKEEETPTEEQPQEPEAEENEERKRRSKVVNVNKNNHKMENFSIIKAISAVAEGRSLRDEEAQLVDMGRRSMAKSNVAANGQIVLPTMRGITAGAAGSGKEAVATEWQNMLAPLYTKSALAGLGATMLDGLTGDIEIPVLGAGAAAWATETGAASDAGQSTKAVKLQPKRLTTYVDISKQFLLQDSVGAEALIRADLVRAIQDKLEQTIFGTAKTSGQPEGIFAYKESATALAYGDVVDLIGSLESANVYNGKFLLHPLAKAALSKVGVKGASDTASLGFVFGDGKVLGIDAVVSGNVVSKGIAYGAFEDLTIGQWGGVDITVDPYSQAINGNVRLVVNAYFDAVWRRQTSTTSGETTTVTLDTVKSYVLA